MASRTTLMAFRAHYASVRGEAQASRRAGHSGPSTRCQKGLASVNSRPNPIGLCGRTRMLWDVGGNSQRFSLVEIRICFLLSQKGESLVELLTVIAHYHRTGSRLDIGHTVNFGRSWLPKSRCTFGLLSLPYLDRPELEEFSWDSVVVRCLWLIPITEGERAFKTHGLEELEALFEEKGFDYIDPFRPSIDRTVTGSPISKAKSMLRGRNRSSYDPSATAAPTFEEVFDASNANYEENVGFRKFLEGKKITSRRFSLFDPRIWTSKVPGARGHGSMNKDAPSSDPKANRLHRLARDAATRASAEAIKSGKAFGGRDRAPFGN